MPIKQNSNQKINKQVFYTMKSPYAIITIIVGLIVAFMIMGQIPIISILCLLISVMLGLYARYKSNNVIDNSTKDQDNIENSDNP